MIAEILTLIGAGIIAVVLAFFRGKAKGRDETRKDLENADHRNADAIRRRARDADGVHDPDDQRGWRD